MSPLQLFQSTTTRPRMNLALEEALSRTRTAGTEILFFYRSRPSVVIGRNQNPWAECSLIDLKRRKIPFFRRYSGGGTVYHDEGNLNISYMTDRTVFSREYLTERAAAALRAVGIPAERTERNDLFCCGKKISGSAYRITGDGAYHHATLLVNTDLHVLGNLLSSRLPLTDVRGTVSVRSPVMNLREVRESLEWTEAMEIIAAGVSGTAVSEEDIRPFGPGSVSIPEGFSSVYEELGSSEWLLGKTPHFSLPLVLHGRNGRPPLDVRVDIDRGRISHVSAVDGERYRMDGVSSLLRGTLFTLDAVMDIVSGALDDRTPGEREMMDLLVRSLSRMIP